MTDFLYKWLPIVFGCHCRADRSFFFRGKQFPICARCTGMGIGFLIAAISLWFYRPSFWITVALMIPMIIDGTLQLKTSYESRNVLRCVTGLFFAYGIIAFIVVCDIWAYHLGQELKGLLWQ